MSARIWLGRNGNEQLLPLMSRSFEESEFEILREGRTASGRYVADILAIKKRFRINYDLVTNDIFNTLKDIYDLGDVLKIIIERKDGTLDDYFVKLRPFRRERLMGGRYWEGITLELEEV